MMKYSFSTLGCPGWTTKEMIAAATDLGFSGIECRSLGRLEAQSVALEQIITGCRAKNIEVPCIATDALLHAPDEANMAIAKEHILFAQRLAVPALRVLGDTGPAPSAAIDSALVEQRLKELAPFAEAHGVLLYMESNGVFAQSAQLKALIEAVNSPAVQVLWDIHHPFRYFNETPAETYQNIGKFVCHVHIKDSVLTNGQLSYKMPGHGDLPIAEAMALLKAGGYGGYISLEWTKLWNKELEDAGVAFSHFMYAMQRYA